MIRDLFPLAALALGYPLGLLFFGSLHAVTRGLMQGRMSSVLWQLLRMAVLAVILWGAAHIGALVLLALVGGMMIARHRVLRRANGPIGTVP